MYEISGFTEKSCEVLNLAIYEAKKLGYEVITSAHLLYALCGVDGSISTHILKSVISPFEIEEKIPPTNIKTYKKLSTKNFTPLVKQILEKAKKKAKMLNLKEAGTEHILGEFLQEEENFGILILQEKNVAIETVYIKCLSYNFNWLDNLHKTKKQANILAIYGKDLVKLAKENNLDPLIGRKYEIDRITQTLTRRKKNNPCLIGEAGVGKTAVVEGLAEKIAKGVVPNSLKNKKLVSIDIAAMLSGTKYRGEFEERLKNVLLMSEKNNGIILFIDEIHNIVGTGAAEGAIDAANILKPKLAKGEIQLIGSTTIEEYSKYIESDPALERRFQPIVVEEPTKYDSIKILHGIKQKYENFHNIKISNNAIKSAVELSIRYIPDRFLPDKAIDLIDESAARKKLMPKIYNRKERILSNMSTQEEKKSPHMLTTKDILEVVSLWTNIPIKQLNKNDIEKINSLESEINKQIFGQKKAVKSLVDAIKRNKTGISSEKKPIGNFLFVGPTGVGKTALCTTLAKTFYGNEKNIIKLDMSEYKEANSISKIIGAPPGYVGFDRENPLTNKIKRSPYLVVVFDEIEKAHPDIYNLLLQIMDEGSITDSHSRKINFKNCIIILTSNLNSDGNINNNPIGFSENYSKKEQQEKKFKDNLKKTFKPEFLSRIDEIIIFDELTPAVIKNIIIKQLNELSNRLKKLGHKFIYTNNAVNLIITLNKNNETGARAIKNIITKNVENLISQELLSKAITRKSTITLNAKNKNLTINLEKL